MMVAVAATALIGCAPVASNAGGEAAQNEAAGSVASTGTMTPISAEAAASRGNTVARANRSNRRRSPNSNSTPTTAKPTPTTAKPTPTTAKPTPTTAVAVTSPPTTMAATAGSRQASLWPFAIDSPWNRPLGTGANFALSGDARNQAIRSLAGGAYVNAGSWSIPVYQSSSSDPTYRLQDDGRTIRVPAGASPSQPAGGDQNLVVVSPDGRTVDEFWDTSIGGGSISSGYHVRTDLYGPGVGEGGVRAAGVSAMGGLIRTWELQAGKIDHALVMALSASAQRRGPVWPAISEDGFAADRYAGSIPIGSLFAIPISVDLNSLGLSPSGLAVATAMQRYGVYDMDVADGMVIYAEPSAESLVGPVRSDMSKIAAQLRVVVNNTRTSPSGGGTALAPLAPALR